MHSRVRQEERERGAAKKMSANEDVNNRMKKERLSCPIMYLASELLACMVCMYTMVIAPLVINCFVAVNTAPSPYPPPTLAHRHAQTGAAAHQGCAALLHIPPSLSPAPLWSVEGGPAVIMAGRLRNLAACPPVSASCSTSQTSPARKRHCERAPAHKDATAAPSTPPPPPRQVAIPLSRLESRRGTS